MSRKTTKTSKPQPRRWSLGLFRNEAGELVTTYVTTAGVPIGILKKQFKGKALFHAVYSDLTYGHARARLVKESKLQDLPVVKKATPKKPVAKKAPAKEEHLVKKAA